MQEKVTVRTYTMDDFNKLLTIQKEAFPPPFPEDLWWNREQIQAHVDTFPQGGMIAEYDGAPAGSATSLIIKYDGSPHTWEEVADNGYIKGSHEPDGDSLYGIDVCVRPKFRGQGIAGALYEARKKLVVELGLKRYLAGCRIPNFHEHAEDMSVEEYVEKVVSGEIKDLVLSFMLRQGLKPIQIMEGYLDDEESLNYAVIVEWRNPEIE
ncbi:ribosomal protein S18 acetylase RimI-like enzyme [Evansella vedderi]|uniref:Ribosomal protein S18 acetylase RimI-like enzyme n=1 Tax=Evansella vedderi TaxID=38282 RepID=A0ABU0A1Q1_9BACI|nr:GNAT family N-acetyltransferase [Evansella vedderi]MDQ0257413.1 ribosomal protein S18 acetylase RimI-like enzyme [Evansella vedderi]